MAKKIVLGLLVLAAVTGFLGAQEASSSAKISVGLDVFPMFKGFVWGDSDADDFMFALAPKVEFLVAPHFTAGGALDMYFGKVSDLSLFYFGLAAHGRWYPLSSGLDRLFLDAGLGFNILSVDGDTKAGRGGFAGLIMSLEAGYKLMLTRNFFLEPSLTFVYSKVSIFSVPTPLGWQPGLSIGAAF
jgi:hypothetical protein